ncbi:unnamed protein product [Lepeophtheirus salmonis]|uniref:(salmon louse) hypothetical protein n=1 Tax=Lepeophtheirus salmonis TaxID=72036 RepID=A0A7R8CSG6_LEPSM|nr:unnamed protein product [Lepeophtheirus salmonis]CAF2916603.1 unnamed protein product [Lepeophtheirus salmonis]
MSNLKENSIGQVIVQVAKPKSSLMTIPFGVAVDTYTEVNRFKQSAIATEDTANASASFPPGPFSQHVTDNVDHKLCTLDGNNNFDGMGIIHVSNNENRLTHEDCHDVRNSLGDANTQIVSAALEYAEDCKKHTVVVAHDTDIQMLLMLHWKSSMYLYMLSDQQAKNENKEMWRIENLGISTGNVIRSNILFIPDCCDTTCASLGLALAVPTFVAAGDMGFHVFRLVVIAIELSAIIVTMRMFDQTKTVVELKRNQIEI